MGTLEDLISGLRQTCAGLPDKRRGKNSQYVMADIGMAAFSVFFMQSPSFLAHQRQLADRHGHGRTNCETLFGMEQIPSDNHIRDMLDPVPPECFHQRFSDAIQVLEAGGGLTAFRRLGHHVLIAFDGTEYFRSAKLHCPRCSRVKHGRQHFTHTYRWLGDVPLRDGVDAMTVNWLMIEIRNAAGELTYRNSFITDLPTDRDTVVELAACGRARWKIENESFNTLKTKGYNLEHNFGHGKQHLSAVLAILNLLAFVFHTVADLTYDLWLQAINKAGARSRFFEHLRSITVFLVFPSWQNLLTTLAFVHPPSQPP